ncbi:hypothetical protein AFB00_22075 [Pseudonocardia sp. HH130630-07]|nr:hypothetical protein AFB00_22075 [Pseudonocardia sp. HH130630-07]
MAVTVGCMKPSEISHRVDDGGPVRVGVAVSRTGTYSVEGTSVRHGYELWEQKVAESGGIMMDGVRRPVEVVYYDDQSDPETAIRLVQRLISEDEVDFVFGPYSSGLTIATSAIARQYRTIMFAGGAAANSVFEQGNDYVFSPLSLTSQYTTSGLDLLHARGARSVGIMHTDDAPMIDVRDATLANARRLGMTVTSVQAVPSTATDVRGALTQIAADRPDVFVEAGTSVLGVLATRTLRDIGWAPETLMVQAPTESAFVEQLGLDVAAGIMAPTQWEPSVAYADPFFGTAEQFAQEYRTRFAEDPSYLSAGAAAAAYSLQRALETAGTTDTETVRRTLVDLEFTCFFGPIDFSGPDDPSGLAGANIGREMLTLQVGPDGRRQIIAPPDAAGAEFRPMRDWSER